MAQMEANTPSTIPTNPPANMTTAAFVGARIYASGIMNKPIYCGTETPILSINSLKKYVNIIIIAAISRNARSNSLITRYNAVSYTHLRAHETRHDLVCRLLLEK